MQIQQQRHNVVMIGPAVDGKGGMAEVVRNLLKTDLARRYNIFYLSTIISGSIPKKILVALAQMIRFIFICLFRSPKLVHIHFCSGVSFYRKSVFIIFARLFKIPILLHGHGGRFDSFYENSHALAKIYIRNILGLSSRVILGSSSKLQWVQQHLKHLNPITIPNPIELPEWIANKKNINLSEHIIILYLGEIKKEKGVFDLIEAIPSVIAQCSNARFIICGPGQIKKPRQLCQAKMVQKYVEITGWVDEKTKLNFLHQADILVLPSYYEELPYAVLEGMAAGLAIAASRVGGIPSLIEHGVNGVLFQPGNTSEIASSLNFLIANQGIRMMMGRKNIEKIKDQFNPAKIAASLLWVYQTLIMDDHNEKRIENSRGNYHS